MKEQLIKKLYNEYGLSADDVFQHRHYNIITRSGIEKIQAKAKIEINYEVIACQPDFCTIKATSPKGEGRILPMQTFGSAKHGGKVQNDKGKWIEQGTTTSWYIAEIAEKRAMARLVLKVTGLYEHGFFGEDESEEFKRNEQPKPQQQTKPKMNAKQLLNTAQKVANGEVTLEQVKQHFDLSEEQESKLVDSAI